MGVGVTVKSEQQGILRSDNPLFAGIIRLSLVDGIADSEALS